MGSLTSTQAFLKRQLSSSIGVMEQAETLTWLKILAVLFLSTQPVHLNPHSTRACESIRELCIMEKVV